MPRVKTGFRIDASRLRRKLATARRTVNAAAFKGILMEFARKALTTAAQITPFRDAQLIRFNQAIQYDHRVNYIPSYHTLEDPTLIVNQSDEHWIYCGGKWYRGDWRLPGHVFAAYQQLLSERDRRLDTNRQEFINARSQARFLYKRSWWQAGQSLGFQIPVGRATQSYSRHDPAKDPPKASGTVRGGKTVLSLDIRNPFLEQASRYKSFSGRAILAQAANQHRPKFERDLGVAMRQSVRQSFAP